MPGMDGWPSTTQHRSRIAQIIGAPRADCIIPKTSAGQGLRTVLNALPGTPRVLSTDCEFDSVDVILKQYAAVGRIQLELVSIHAADGRLDLSPTLRQNRQRRRPRRRFAGALHDRRALAEPRRTRRALPSARRSPAGRRLPCRRRRCRSTSLRWAPTS